MSYELKHAARITARSEIKKVTGKKWTRHRFTQLQQESEAKRELRSELTKRAYDQLPFYASFDNAYLNHQNAIESNARTYPRHLPIALKTGRGMPRSRTPKAANISTASRGLVRSPSGITIPLSWKLSVTALEAEVPFQTLDLPTPLKERFIDELFATLPADFAVDAKIQFCGPSGADAIEAAIKLVKTATGGAA